MVGTVGFPVCPLKEDVVSLTSRRRAVLGVAITGVLLACTASARAEETRIVYDDFDAPGYNYDGDR